MLPATVLSEGIHLWRCFYLTGEWPLWGDIPFPEWCLKEIAYLFRRVIRRLSACRRVYILMGKRKAPFLCSEYGLHLLSVRRTNGVKDMEKASVYTGRNISPDLSDQRDRQGQFIWLRQLHLYSLLFFSIIKSCTSCVFTTPIWVKCSLCLYVDAFARMRRLAL